MTTRQLSPRRDTTSEGWTWRHTATWSIGFIVLWLGMFALSKTSDSTRAAAELAASRAGNAVMVCVDGRVDYPRQTTFDELTARIFSDGTFMCTEWRTRESLIPSN